MTAEADVVEKVHAELQPGNGPVEGEAINMHNYSLCQQSQESNVTHNPEQDTHDPPKIILVPNAQVYPVSVLSQDHAAAENENNLNMQAQQNAATNEANVIVVQSPDDLVQVQEGSLIAVPATTSSESDSVLDIVTSAGLVSLEIPANSTVASDVSISKSQSDSHPTQGSTGANPSKNAEEETPLLPILFQVLMEDGKLKNVNTSPVTNSSGPEKPAVQHKQPVTFLGVEEKPFRCDLCTAMFTRLGNYTRHRMIHTVNTKDDYRYKCEACGRMFLQRCDLKRHMQIHEGNEPFRCDICSKGYVRKSDLVIHMRFHNKERSFRCDKCTKAFYQSGDLNRHVRQVHLHAKQLTCGHCQRKYSKEATLIRHMQTVHRDIILESLGERIIIETPTGEKEVNSHVDSPHLMKENRSECLVTMGDSVTMTTGEKSDNTPREPKELCASGDSTNPQAENDGS